MSNIELDEFSKPKKVRKVKVHREPIVFDDDFEEVHPRKQAGKKKSSRHINKTSEIDFEDEDLGEYIYYLK